MSLAILFVLIFLLPPLALAHHGGSEYDQSKTVEFKGKLTRVEMINPHSWIYFDVAEKDGTVSHHRCEMRSVHVLRRSGWTKENFPVGQMITVEASPNRTDPASCYLQTIVAADGTRMDRYGQYIKAPQGGIQEVRGPIAAPKANRPARRPSGEPNIAGDWAPVQLVMVNAKGTGGGLVPLDKLTDYKPGDRPAFPFPNGRAGTGPRRYGGTELTEGGETAAKEFKRQDDPRFHCETTSIVFDWTFDGPVNRITQNKDTITLEVRTARLQAHHLHEYEGAPPQRETQPRRALHRALGRRHAGG